MTIGRAFFLVLLDEHNATNFDEIYICRFKGKWPRKQQNLNALFALLGCLFLQNFSRGWESNINQPPPALNSEFIYLILSALSGYSGRTGNWEGKLERYIILWARLGFCSHCSKQGRNQIPQDWLYYTGFWSSDGWCSSQVEPFMDDYALHKQTHSTDDIDKLCALILPERSHSLIFHFHSLFLNILNQDLFLIAVECFPLTRITKEINEETNLDEFLSSARLLQSTSPAAACSCCCSFCSHLVILRISLAGVCLHGRKRSGQDFWFICFLIGGIFWLHRHSLQAVCMTNASPRLLHLGRCCKGIFTRHLAQSSAKLAWGTERKRMKKLPESINK